MAPHRSSCGGLIYQMDCGAQDAPCCDGGRCNGTGQPAAGEVAPPLLCDAANKCRDPGYGLRHATCHLSEGYCDHTWINHCADGFSLPNPPPQADYSACVLQPPSEKEVPCGPSKNCIAGANCVCTGHLREGCHRHTVPRTSGGAQVTDRGGSRPPVSLCFGRLGRVEERRLRA